MNGKVMVMISGYTKYNTTKAAIDAKNINQCNAADFFSMDRIIFCEDKGFDDFVLPNLCSPSVLLKIEVFSPQALIS